ncbi:hypothetical protein B5E56_00335 [Flavonifractor sp. An112]|uniref:hypothetical protein n=1 Tax=Flavonifractor sp. An112 TaxID=1965544 RepID=UPI000B36609A|nr:hypothetical protein [Flavonifractor sp. An112]OUQ61764.1 hypothetical protein B5E56_00335 [Flavonifractor sp. An112]
MKQMTWDDYYGGFYDWSPSTQKNYTYRLSDYGSAGEVWEVAQELAFQDEAFATKFLEKALAAGVRFTPDQVLEMMGTVEESVLRKTAERTDVPFDREQLEEIYMMIDDASFQRISRRAKINVFDDEPAAYEQPEQVQYILPKKKKVGLFTALAAFAAGSPLAGQVRKKHDGHCDGDCANCPPHYGYRYGRWYYGKGHQYGCEFGGNKGDGNL